MTAQIPNRVPTQVIDAIEQTLGPSGCIRDAELMEPYLADRRGKYVANTPLVARPRDTDEVAAVMRICHQHGVGVVPQGGNTGLVGGSVPDESGSQIVLSLARLRQVREVDALNYSITVEAGCVLADVQSAAADNGLLFPLSLAAEGSCQIGGNLGTNAGGTQVLRYGNARDLVLGLEVVLADGKVWDGLRRLRKDNTGYNLKHLFIGSEGTLGVITAAIFKLFPQIKQELTGFVALASAHAASQFLARLKRECGDCVTTFEYMHRNCLDLVFRKIPGIADPLDETYQHYVLVQIDSVLAGDELQVGLQQALEQGLEDGEVLNATIANSSDQAARLWRIREAIPEAARISGAGIRHDVAVPVSRVADFLAEATALVERIHPKSFLIPFGHMGDGNIHFNLIQSDDAVPEVFLAPEDELRQAVYQLVHSMQGSFSAEHGIGRLKRDDLIKYRDPLEVEMMRSLKGALDPAGILNPGKVL